ncbi:hypothetical protein BDZ89DRAFT_1060469 [Hymenopellis radicata]|nr:hypothetical protein BDZ89DRAFT_1060469 [Hymenopellis radicata]
MPEHSPVATKLAEDLGLTKDVFVPVDAERDVVLTKQLTDLFTNNDEDTMEAIMSSFCARYLPALVSAYRAAKGINIYTRLLRSVAEYGYFAKYMRAHPDAKTLLQFHAQLLLDADPLKWVKIWEDTDTVTSLFKFLLVYASHYPTHVDPIPEATQKELTDLYGAVAHFYYNEVQKNLGGFEGRRNSVMFQSAWDTQRALEGKMEMDKLLGAIGQMMPLVTCGAEQAGCWKKGKQPGLAACTRCRTTTYCSKAHQQLDWKRHKKVCFETVY